MASKTLTITDLESKLHCLKQAKNTKENTEKSKEIKAKIKHQKELNKLTATKLEINNYSRLIFFDSTGGYAKLTDNSAIIYTANIAKRIGRRVNLRPDTDNYAKSNTGTVSVKLNDELTDKLNAIGIIKDKALSTPHIHAYKLSEPISPTYFKTLEDTIKKDSNRINQIVMPHNPVPTLFVYIKELLEICYYNSKSMPEFPRTAFGKPLAQIPNEMLTEYLRYTDNRIKKSEMAKSLYIGANKIKRQMKTMEILHLISNRNICRILEKAIAIERLANKYYQEEMKNGR